MGAGKLVQIWRSPGFKKEVFGFELVRTLADCNDKVTALNWSPDSKYLLVGSKDLAARLFYVNEKLKGVQSNKPFLLLGHRDSIVGCFFGVDERTDTLNKIYTITLSVVGVIVAVMVNWMKLEGKTQSHPHRVLQRGTAKVRRGKILMGKVSIQILNYWPLGQMITKSRVWTVSSRFCFVTFAEHTNAVTALHFMANNHCPISASLDGTVCAWDLFRYRNFRTFTTPSFRQFVSLAADQSGEVICAGTLDSFEIFVWSMKRVAVDAALNEDQPSRALILNLRLNEDSLIKKCIFAVSPVDIPAVTSSITHRYMQRLIEAVAELLESCPHLEFILCWCQELCKSHGSSIQQNSRNLLPSLKSLQKVITRIHQDLADTCSSNEYMLRYLCSVGDKK
ncbi:hypothetical protein LWI29_016985 [Acer saccharum]|uniref:Small-subunit processome Utp12 domain-containing protein n=1 Tax=Acer saccharum TaxID=4024 RepID=A0AA39SVM2_ACESA|nr:hypothetical protein LWI29_016985 [Acer saccharum]